MPFKRVLNTDSGFKAAAWTLENKNDNVNISWNLNSAFSTIGKARADKITAKFVGKTHTFAQFCMREKFIRTRVHAANHAVKFRTFFLCFKISFFASS